MTAPRDDATVTLADGRRLAYARWGAPHGPTLLAFHGWPGSRLVGALLAHAAADRGVRLVTVDRPGMGRSDFLPDRALRDWSADVAALADTLGLDRFHVVGLSAGAHYALACAHDLADRLAGVAVVSGIGPADVAAVRAHMAAPVRALWTLSRRAPDLARASVGALGEGIKRMPAALLKQTLFPAAADRRVMRRRPVAAAVRAELLEAFASGPQGLTHEVAINGSPWGFRLDAVAPTVHLFHGGADRNVPAAVGSYVAAQLGRCHPRFVPGAGHLWFVDHFAEVIDALIG